MARVCIYIYTYAYSRTRIQTHIHAYMRTCIHSHAKKPAHVRAHVHAYGMRCVWLSCLHACLHACMHACVHWTHALCLHAYAHTYMHTSGIRARVCLAGWLHVCQSCPVLTCPFCVLSLCLSPASVRIYAWMYVCMPAYTHMYETVCMYVCLDAWMVRCMHM